MNLLENYQALIWGIFQIGKFLREKATLLFTANYWMNQLETNASNSGRTEEQT